MSGPIQQENLGFRALGENVFYALIVSSPVHILDGHGNFQRRRQSDDVNVIRLFVHRFHFLVAKVFDAATAVDEIDVKIGVFLKLTGSYEAQENDEIIREALIVEAADEIAVDGSFRGFQLLHGFHERVVKILDGKLGETQSGNEQIFHVGTSLFESLALGWRRGGGGGIDSLGEEEILEVGETEGTEKAVPITASST